MQSFDDMLKKMFENSDFPNPFDPEGFGRFLQEQIKSAISNDPNTLNQVGSDQMGMSRLQGNRQGTISGLNRASNLQTAQNSPQNAEHQHELNYQAFETHDELIVRVQIPNASQRMPQRMKLTSYQIAFTNEESENPLLQIQLPKAIDIDQTRWGFREGILEVRLSKRPFEPGKEIDITAIYKTKGNG